MTCVYRLMASRVAVGRELRIAEQRINLSAGRGDSPGREDASRNARVLEGQLAAIDARLDRCLGPSFRRHFRPWPGSPSR